MEKHRGVTSTNHPSRKPSGSGSTSPFVGREAELRRLNVALHLAAKGQGSTIFLTGQPGIGKTRLAREAVNMAKDLGFTALQGRAYSLGTGLAYAPILDALGPYLRSLEPARLSLLLKGLPDLGRLLGGLGLPSLFLHPEGLGDPALERTRLFETTLRLLVRLAEEAPVILYIDDLHWADSASLEMMHYLARGLAEQRAVLLATYSTGPLNMSSGLRALVGPLQREGLAEEIVLSALGPETVEKLARGFLGGEPPDNLLTLLDERAGGTPLFVEAFMSSLIDSGHLAIDPTHGKGLWLLNTEEAFVLPESIRHLVLERLTRLTPTDRRIVDLIAVIGMGTSHDVLRSASGMEENTLLASLQSLRAAGILSEGTDGQDVIYNLTHPQIQEVAYAELPEMARRHIHVAAIEAIESSRVARPEDVNRLARHYRGAGPEADQNRALGVLLAAGDHARALYANQEAAQHYSAALGMVRQGRCSTDLVSSYFQGEAPLPWLLERLGEAWGRLGEGGAAAALWKEAISLLAEGDQAGHSDRRTVSASRLRSMLALVECERGQFDIALSHLRAGLAALAGHEACQEVADLHFERFYILDRLGDIAGMAETIAELQSVANRLGSPRAEAEASLITAIFRMWQNDLTGACEGALHAVNISESAQELTICCLAYRTLTSIGLRLGDHHFMRRNAKNALAVTQRLGAPSMEIRSHVLLAWADFLAGAWDESRRVSIEAIALARRVGSTRDLVYSIAGNALLLSLQGDLPAAEARIA
ncbi:MAG: AAA family ATPase, partial [Dehalococcoidia bacterium]|nr:AAA family ATPase [Dehalococcoidia bacterium]